MDGVEAGFKRLAFEIIKQAYEDYYDCCKIPEKLPARPKVEVRIKGKKMKELMTDHQFHLWLVDQEFKRRSRKKQLEQFFHSGYYELLTERKVDYMTTNRILEGIEKKRKKGIPLYEKMEE